MQKFIVVSKEASICIQLIKALKEKIKQLLKILEEA